MMVQPEAIEFVGASASNGVEMRAARADAEEVCRYVGMYVGATA